MNEEFEALHQKLDYLLAELAIIKANLLAQGNISPPLNLRQAAAYLHLSESRVYDLVYTGKLAPLQHNKHGRLLFNKEQLNQYLYAQSSTRDFSSKPLDRK